MIHFQLHVGQTPRVSNVCQSVPQPPIVRSQIHRSVAFGLHRHLGQKISDLFMVVSYSNHLTAFSIARRRIRALLHAGCQHMQVQLQSPEVLTPVRLVILVQMPKRIIHARVVKPPQHAFKIEENVHDVIDRIANTHP